MAGGKQHHIHAGKAPCGHFDYNNMTDIFAIVSDNNASSSIRHKKQSSWSSVPKHRCARPLKHLYLILDLQRREVPGFRLSRPCDGGIESVPSGRGSLRCDPDGFPTGQITAVD